MHEIVSSGEGGGVMGNMSRRGESSLLCMKFESAFIAGDCVLIRVLPSTFLALTVNELGLHFHAFCGLL
jgi:hypothetical protein